MKIFRSGISKFVLVILLITFSSSLWSYEAILSQEYNTSSYFISYEGKDKTALLKSINKELDLYFAKENYYFSKLQSEQLETIDKAQMTIEYTIKAIQQIVTLEGLYSSKLLTNKKEMAKLALVLVGQVKILLDEMGIKVTNDEDLKAIVDVAVPVVIEFIANTVEKGAKSPVNPLEQINNILELVQVENKLIATSFVNENILLYQYSSMIANAYIRYYVNNIVGSNKKTISLKEFIEQRYLNDKYEIVTFSEISKDVNLPYETGKYKLKNHILDPLYVRKDFSYSIKSFAHNIVAVPMDVYTRTKESGLYENYLNYLKDLIRIRLVNLRLVGQIIKLKIEDNYEDTVAAKGILKYHNVSDLSTYQIQMINGAKGKDDIRISPACQEFIEFKNLEIKTNNFSVFDLRNVHNKCGAIVNKMSFTFEINQNKYELIDDFSIKERYTTLNKELKIYKDIRTLRTHNIYFSDTKNINLDRNVEGEELMLAQYSLMYSIYQKKASSEIMDEIHSRLKDKIGSSITYLELFKELTYFLGKLYPTNPASKDYFYNNNQASIYPNPNHRSLKMLLNRKRKQAKNVSVKNYILYLDRLSKAGIIKLEINTVAENINKKVLFKDYIKYISRVIEFAKIKGE